MELRKEDARAGRVDNHEIHELRQRGGREIDFEFLIFMFGSDGDESSVMF